MSAVIARRMGIPLLYTRYLTRATFSYSVPRPLEARHITSNDDFVEHVVNSSLPVVVTFHAEWCEPCKILLPKLRSIIEPLASLELAVVDVEKHPELVESFEVKAVPAVVAMRNGTVVDKFIGLVDDTMIKTLLGKLTGDKSDKVTNS